ncbi:MAG: hypothetical protein JXR18_14780 [Neptuniibacter sp.]
MNGKAKYFTCSQCVKAALDIQSHTSDKQWRELGNSRPQCDACLKALKAKLYPDEKESQS